MSKRFTCQASDGLTLFFRGPFFNPKLPERLQHHLKMDVQHGVDDLCVSIASVFEAKTQMDFEIPEPVWIGKETLRRLQRWLHQQMQDQVVKALTKP